jgi:hypothetical protein
MSVSPGMRVFGCVAAALWLASAHPAGQSTLKECVVDEARSDPSLVAFRTALMKTVNARNSAQLLGVIDRTIRLAPGSAPQGLSAFESTHKPSDRKSPLWTTLAFVLDRGGRMLADGTFEAPGFSCGGAEGIGRFSACIAGKNVRVHETPSTTSRVLAMMSCQRVPGNGEERGLPKPVKKNDWLPVVLGNRWGYVETKYVVLGDLRLDLKKIDGTWRVTGFWEAE